MTSAKSTAVDHSGRAVDASIDFRLFQRVGIDRTREPLEANGVRIVMANVVRLAVFILVMISALFVGIGFLNRISGIAPPPTEKRNVVGRRVFSPDVRHDPYVREQLATAVRALEEDCRRARRYCAEAQKAREAMDNLDPTRLSQ